jgi:hypothetical protein
MAISGLRDFDFSKDNAPLCLLSHDLTPVAVRTVDHAFDRALQQASTFGPLCAPPTAQHAAGAHQQGSIQWHRPPCAGAPNAYRAYIILAYTYYHEYTPLSQKHFSQCAPSLAAPWDLRTQGPANPGTRPATAPLDSIPPSSHHPT